MYTLFYHQFVYLTDFAGFCTRHIVIVYICDIVNIITTTPRTCASVEL